MPQGGYADPEGPAHQFKSIDELRSTRASGPSAGTPALNPMCIEMYLSDEEFVKTFGMDKASFYQQKQWKQRELKKKAGCF